MALTCLKQKLVLISSLRSQVSFVKSEYQKQSKSLKKLESKLLQRDEDIEVLLQTTEDLESKLSSSSQNPAHSESERICELESQLSKYKNFSSVQQKQLDKLQR